MRPRSAAPRVVELEEQSRRCLHRRHPSLLWLLGSQTQQLSVLSYPKITSECPPWSRDHKLFTLETNARRRKCINVKANHAALLLQTISEGKNGEDKIYIPEPEIFLSLQGMQWMHHLRYKKQGTIFAHAIILISICSSRSRSLRTVRSLQSSWFSCPVIRKLTTGVFEKTITPNTESLLLLTWRPCESWQWDSMAWSTRARIMEGGAIWTMVHCIFQGSQGAGGAGRSDRDSCR